jgi:hypothetical protein
MRVGAPANRYRFDGEYSHIPMMTPRIAPAVPTIAEYVATRIHTG